MQFTIGADHPSLPGHFPGSPVVPGVVVLTHVLGALPVTRGSVVKLSWVKFLKPLLPGPRAEVKFTAAGEEIRFSVSHGAEVLVRGSIRQVAPAAPA